MLEPSARDCQNLIRPSETRRQPRNGFRTYIPESTSRSEISGYLLWPDENKRPLPYAEVRLFRPVWTKDGRFATV